MSLLLFAIAQTLPPPVAPPPVAPPPGPPPARAVAPDPAVPLTIDWQVADRFRLFDHASTSARQKVEAAMALLANSAVPQDDKPLYDQLLGALGGNGDDARSLRRFNIALRSGRNYSNSYRQDYVYPAQYWIRVTATGAPAGAACHWTVDGAPASTMTDSVPDAAATCTAHLIDLPATAAGDGASGAVGLTVGDGPAQPAVTIALKDELIVALGDSYISGEGNPDVPAAFHPLRQGRAFSDATWAAAIKGDTRSDPSDGDVTPAIWWDQRCHRSLLSWPVLASLAHAGRDPHRAVTLVHLGCSGAETGDVFRHGQHDLPGGKSDQDSQLDTLDALLKRTGAPPRPIDTMFLSIGGNDGGFGGVVKMLLLTSDDTGWLRQKISLIGGATCPYRQEGDSLGPLCGSHPELSAQALLDGLATSLADLDEQLVRRVAAPGRIFQASYPSPLLDGDQAMCASAPAPVDSGYAGMLALLRQKLTSIFATPRLWPLELTYRPDANFPTAPPYAPLFAGETPGTAQCDMTPDPNDSELCQAYWVWATLNERVVKGARDGQLIPVDAYQDAIRGHGWCDASATAPLALPIADGQGGWKAPGGKPGDFDPYAFALPRWFRTANDSIMTEWSGSKDFHYGTMHPTFHAHLAIAAAMDRQAFGGQ